MKLPIQRDTALLHMSELERRSYCKLLANGAGRDRTRWLDADWVSRLAPHAAADPDLLTWVLRSRVALSPEVMTDIAHQTESSQVAVMLAADPVTPAEVLPELLAKVDPANAAGWLRVDSALQSDVTTTLLQARLLVTPGSLERLLSAEESSERTMRFLCDVPAPLTEAAARLMMHIKSGGAQLALAQHPHLADEVDPTDAQAYISSVMGRVFTGHMGPGSNPYFGRIALCGTQTEEQMTQVLMRVDANSAASAATLAAALIEQRGWSPRPLTANPHVNDMAVRGNTPSRLLEELVTLPECRDSLRTLDLSVGTGVPEPVVLSAMPLGKVIRESFLGDPRLSHYLWWVGKHHREVLDLAETAQEVSVRDMTKVLAAARR